ncbi:Nramp family divalent metal transporter [Caulobacter sp. 17J65-9]|uniref:Nramp family divalent metal transporter n=1 Tax=Caulobacter sp. 17J65-9 TaxID=2709382 RepID=UPI00196A0911|nr:Nramp family divalent metal transporter [Caulobacter sp. 17J65-9]
MTPRPREIPTERRPRNGKSFLRELGLGVITGAADDDPSAIGTYASAGARFGLGFLWIAPVLLPMMYVVVYLSAKIGQVGGEGLFAAIRERFPRWVLYPTLVFAFTGNVIEAAADLGGIGAALNLLVPIPIPWIVAGTAVVVFALQYFGSYGVLRDTFRWLALALLAYIGAAVLARPDPLEVLRATFVPRVEFTQEFLSLVVACIGTSLSAYIYTWQSNQEVEEEIAQGRVKLWQRRGATREELRRTRRDVLIGMIFSNVILYFIILSTGATLHPAGQTEVATAAHAAAALKPLAGEAAGLLFALGVVGVGVMAVPVMTAGAAYDLVQAFGRKGSLQGKPRESKLFYATIAVVTAVAVGLNFLGFNPMKALVWSGIVQGFSVPPLLLLMMLMTNDRRLMGERTNGRFTNALGWTTTVVTFAATAALVATWIL